MGRSGGGGGGGSRRGGGAGFGLRLPPGERVRVDGLLPKCERSLYGGVIDLCFSRELG